MPRLKHYNYDQDAMVVIDYQDQPQPGTFGHANHYLIERKLDRRGVTVPPMRTIQLDAAARSEGTAARRWP